MTTVEHLPKTSEAVSGRLLVKIAELYYLDDLTQLQISRRLGLSRQKVQRLIHAAKERGIVHITIQPMRSAVADLDHQLEERFGLQEAVVADMTEYDDDRRVLDALGPAAADYLTRIVRDGDCLAISWGGTFARSSMRCPSRAERCKASASSRPWAGWAIPTRKSTPAILPGAWRAHSWRRSGASAGARRGEDPRRSQGALGGLLCIAGIGRRPQGCASP